MKVFPFALTILLALLAYCPVVVAAELTISTTGKPIVFSGIWQAAPTSVGSLYQSGDASSFMLSPGAAYHQINDGHFQLLKGAMLVRANNKAVFISHLWIKDKIITRVAPHAIALISAVDNQSVTNLSKRCCGAVISYLPACQAEGANRFGLETGQTLTFLPVPTDEILAATGKSVETSDGRIFVSSKRTDVSELMHFLFE